MSLEHAVLAWLKAQAAASPEDSEKREALDVAVQCLSNAFGIAEDAPTGRYELSQMWSTGVSLMKAEEAKQKAKCDANPAFPNFVKMLAAKKYFGGHAEGTDAYEDRLVKARVKFLQFTNKASEAASEVSEQKSSAVPAASTSTSPSTAAFETPQEDPKEKAKQHKIEGNRRMKAHSYAAAVESYSKAIELDPTSSVYYANRSAAYGRLNKLDEAVADGEKAIELDPTYAKAYWRLGSALLQQHRYEEAVKQFETALEHVTDAQDEQTLREGLANARQRLAASGTGGSPAPDASAAGNLSSMLANMLGGGGGGAAGGLGGGGGDGGAPAGMPDLSSLLGALPPEMTQMMQDPTFMQQAQQMASSLMQDPSAMSNMMGMLGGMGGGGGAPAAPSANPLDSLNFDTPQIQELAASDPAVADFVHQLKDDPSTLSSLISDPANMAVVQKLMAIMQNPPSS